jgi:uncharacterized protein (TIGR02001 family)
MKLTKKFTSITAGSALLIGGMAAPLAAQAAGSFSADVTAASMYLWRGTDVSAGGPAVSGSLGWDSGAGFYVNTWASSGYSPDPDSTAEAAASNAYSGYEWDVWAGYAGEIKGFSYDVSVWQIMYPEGSTASSPDGLQAGTELSLGLGYQDFSFSYTVNSGERYTGEPDYSYMTLGYTMGDWGFTFGTQDVDAPDSDWSHLDVSYSLSDEASVTLSKASRDGTGGEEDPLIVFSYTMPIDLKK